MQAQLLLWTRPAAYFPTVTLVKTSGDTTCLQKTSCLMIPLLISNSLHLSVSPSKLVTDISVLPNLLYTIFEYLHSFSECSKNTWRKLGLLKCDQKTE
jgi:hypothetical protein